MEAASCDRCRVIAGGWVRLRGGGSFPFNRANVERWSPLSGRTVLRTWLSAFPFSPGAAGEPAPVGQGLARHKVPYPRARCVPEIFPAKPAQDDAVDDALKPHGFLHDVLIVYVLLMRVEK